MTTQKITTLQPMNTGRLFLKPKHAGRNAKGSAKRSGAIIKITKPQQSSSETNPESLTGLIPVKVTDPVRSLVAEYCQAKGADYVKRSIEYVNRNITDRRKYRAALEKCLAENQAGGTEVKEKNGKNKNGIAAGIRKQA